MNQESKAQIEVVNFRATPEERLLLAQVAERLDMTRIALIKSLVRRAASDLGLIHPAKVQNGMCRKGIIS
jgi:hypothetical protein